MSRKTIVEGGHQAFQLPVPMLEWLFSGKLGGRALRVLLWILWDAQQRDVWPQLEDEPVDKIVRLARRDLSAGAGLDPDNGHAGVRDALRRLADLGSGDLPTLLNEGPGPYFDVLLPRALAEENWRPLERYALLNMDHIRQLREPLDFALYACACLVARARRPQFELTLDEIAGAAGSRQVNWDASRRPFRGACERVARVTGARLLIQGWCGGDHAGIDRLLVRVGLPGQAMDTRFRPQVSQRFFEADPDGWRPFDPSGR